MFLNPDMQASHWGGPLCWLVIVAGIEFYAQRLQ